MVSALGMDDRLMFASDYPHWDFDSPDRVLPSSLIGPELHAKVFFQNALDLFAFGLEDDRIPS
jgi:predicted TIM-barrel fold metal-dependent hydrolase